MTESELAQALVTADDPLDVLFQALNDIWQVEGEVDINRFFVERERATNQLERFMLHIFFDLYDLLLARVREARHEPRFADWSGSVIVLDGASLREANLLLSRLPSYGYAVTDYAYALSEVPSDTETFRQRVLGMPAIRSRARWGEYTIVPIRSGEVPKLLPEAPRLLVWISYPDELLHKVRGKALTPQEALDKTVAALVEVLDMLEADEVLVTSDHGYLYIKSAALFWKASPGDEKALRKLFGGKRALPIEEVGREFDKLRRVPRDRTYALFDDEGCYIRGRYAWSVQRDPTDVNHGGISLMECLVPVMRIRRKKR